MCDCKWGSASFVTGQIIGKAQTITRGNSERTVGAALRGRPYSTFHQALIGLPQRPQNLVPAG